MELTHFDEKGNAVMVNVGAKADTERTATARGSILMSKQCYEMIKSGGHKKGDVLNVARIAGIMAVKKTADLIPLCHNIFITKAALEFTLDETAHRITAACTVHSLGQTGVEMEALTGANIALLTIYDMCKAVDRSMELTDIYVAVKAGGKSGRFTHPKDKGYDRPV